MSVANVVNAAADSLGGKAGLPGKAAGQAGQQARANDALAPNIPKESATDVAVNAWNGWDPTGKKTTSFKDGMKKAFEGGVRSPAGLSGIGESASQSVSQIGTDLENIGKAKGALQTVGAVFATLTSIEQLVSAPFAAIPFPSFPALRITDMDVGLPHAHAHPPNLPPPPPIPLPSTGPVIPIPFVSGANKVLINALPAARCGDMGLGIWCGGYVPLYEVFLGSASVWIEGARAARLGVDITNHCIFSARPGPKDPPVGPFVGFTIMASANVMIGGVPMPSLTSMAMGAFFKQAFKFAGKVISALAKRSARFKKVVDAITNMGKKANQSWKNLFNKKAIQKSGIPPAHAKGISQVAQDSKQILMFQNVNPAAKELIENGAATKGMNIKGKSDINGQIPMDQSKSAKGSKMGDEWVEKQNKSLDELVNPKDAKGNPLPSEYTTIPGKDGNPVLAKNVDGKPVPVTSDYDMLATGSKAPAETPEMKGDKGIVTPTQEKTIDDINKQIDHPGGPVVHHGPENQYPGQGPPKDGPKYPVTAFEPDGSVKSFNNDKELKDYMNTKKYEGYNGMEPHPSWGWEKGPDGYYK